MKAAIRFARDSEQKHSARSVPRKKDMNENFWFVNAGILSNPNFNKALLFIGTTKLSTPEFCFVLFLGIKYLIHYIELFTFDNSSLLSECITKQLKYLQTLLGKHDLSRKYLNYGFIIKLQFVFENLQNVPDQNYANRQMYIDQLERFCHSFAIRLNIWLKNPRLQAYLFRFGFDPHRSCVIYNSFLIPNEEKYTKPLCHLNQRFLEKIESKCCCKIKFTNKSPNCCFCPEYVTIEVIFDLYRGNYSGFIEMFGYVIKRLNFTQYFAKSLRTVLLDRSVMYNILTNVPIKNLRYLEKSVIAGSPIAPFLDGNTISKQIFSIIAVIREQDTTVDGSQLKEPEDYLPGLDIEKKYYKHHSTLEELNKLEKVISEIDYSIGLMKYFQSKYDEEDIQIKSSQNVKDCDSFKSSAMDSKIKVMMVVSHKKSSSNGNCKVNQKVEGRMSKSQFHEAVPENLLQFQMEILSVDNDVLDETIINQNANDKVDNQNHCSIDDKTEDINDTLRLTDLLETEQDYVKCDSFQINENNTFKESSPNTCVSEFIDLNNTTSSNHFNIFIHDSFNEYSNEYSWTNHKMRLMLRCDTEETLDDIKYPYNYEKKSIQDRLHRLKKYRRKFLKFKSLTKSYLTAKKTNSKFTATLSHQPWLSREASMILLEGSRQFDENDSTLSTSSSDSVVGTMDLTELNKELPFIGKYIESFEKRLIDVILQRKLFKKRNWIRFFESNFDFHDSREMDILRLCNSHHIYKIASEQDSSRLEKLTDPLTKKLFAILILLTKGKITDKNFQDMLDGRGVNFPVIKKINNSPCGIPTYIGNLDKLKKKDHLMNLSRCLCQLVYDLVQLAHEGSKGLFYILNVHISQLEDIVMELENTDLKAALSILRIRKKLLSLNTRSYNNDKRPNKSMIYMSEELSLIHDIMFKEPCCSFKIGKHLGLHILYHSLQLDDKSNAVEPFLKLPGDRRIRKIEKICNCCISLRSNRHPIIPIDQYFIDIFYDYDSGNHFGTIDLIKQMMTASKNFTILQEHRTLVVYPSGELWVFRDTEWLKKCYSNSQEDKTMWDIYLKNADEEEVLS